MDCWLDLGQMDLESRQPSYAKVLGQCQLVEKPSAVNLKFIWYIFEDLSKIHLQHDHCEVVILNLWLVEFIYCMGYFKEDYEVDKLGWGHLYLMPLLFKIDIIVHLCFAWFKKVQGNSGFLLTILSIGLLPIWSDLFNSKLLIFVHKIVSSSFPPLL